MPIELVTLRGVELLEVGEDWETSTGVFTFTAEDLVSAINAGEDPAVRTPVLKFGHTDPRFDGDFSIGRIENLGLTNNGMTLVGDYVGVPTWLAEIMASAYPRRSIEGMWDWETETGNRHPFFLTAVALLGATYPAISTLEDIKEFWSGEPVEWVEVAASADPPYAYHAPRGMMMRANRVEAETMPSWRRKNNPSAAVEVDDIRREYYDTLEMSESWWWIRAIQVEPPQLIVDDDEGGLYRVPYTASGDTVTFDDPIKVQIEYKDVAAGDKAAASAPSWAFGEALATYPTREAARPATMNPRGATANPEDSMTPEQKAMIGLPADATDEQVNAKLTALAATASDTPPADPATPPADPATPPADPATPPADPATPPADPATPPVVPDGAVLVDAAAWAEVQATAKRVNEEFAANAAKHQKDVVSAAIRAGKFPPSQKAHYEALMAKSPAETEALIAVLAAGTIPVTDPIGLGDADASTADAIAAAAYYPPSWLPEVAARAGGSSVPTITREN